MKHLLILSVTCTAGCASNPLEVTSGDDVILTGHRGGCFIGCNWKFREPDGSKCRGFGFEPIEGRPLGLSVYCSGRSEDDPTAANLVAERYTEGGTSDAIYNGNAVVVKFK